ncbi:unnamed protein product [Didymodactylos carnosus]|uniref:Uncharacterized protein n=1 Tax=Didymodactylos carnosus TaxID=1234261 RepID=A0A815QTW8_9BILA|nr:unnamed protein product [Didymodactylos carnosus]CAF4336475.1 unnamed protein product [Didymodactylos carnosus]
MQPVQPWTGRPVMIAVPGRTPRQQMWRKTFPRGIAALIGTCQMFLTFGILACETLSMIVDFYHAMLFVGYWAGAFFTITWISVYGSLCCKGRGCTTYTLVTQVICLCLAICVLVIDIIFLSNPFLCFYGTYTCTSSSSTTYTSWSFLASTSDIYNLKVPILKGQLAGAVLMLVLAIIYIILYIVTAVKVRGHSNAIPENRIPLQTKVPTTVGYQEPQVSSYSSTPSSLPINAKRGLATEPEEEIECYNCHNKITLPQRRY